MDKVTIKIPRTLYEKIRVLIEGSGFSSPTEFVVYVLRDLVSDRGLGRMKNGGELTAEELQAIRKRLQNLGYL